MKKQSKYQEVVSYLKNGIESGRFPTGSRLPSIRQLSLDFHCSKAYCPNEPCWNYGTNNISMPSPRVATMS